jgi:ParB/RepB/Spo0J family partition protein
VNAVLLDTPDRTKAAMLRAVAAEAHPKLALGAIAHRFGVPLADLKTIIDRFGYPDPAMMRNHAAALEAGPQSVTRQPIPDDGPSTPELPVEGHLVRVDVNRLHPDPDNPREHLTGIEELAASIKQVGLLEPIVVRRRAGNILSIVAGHRRKAALVLLGHTETDVLLKPIPADDVLLAMLIENGQREDLDPIAEARGIAKIKERFDLSDIEVGARLGRSQPWVSNRLALLHLSEDEQAAIRAGTMTLARGTDQGRRLGHKNRPAAKGKASAAHLAFNHPLASAVEICCRQRGHHKNSPGRVGGIGCGQCWEDCIRADERNKLARGRQADNDLRGAVRGLADDWKNAGRDDVAGELDALLDGATS